MALGLKVMSNNLKAIPVQEQLFPMGLRKYNAKQAIHG